VKGKLAYQWWSSDSACNLPQRTPWKAAPIGLQREATAQGDAGKGRIVALGGRHGRNGEIGNGCYQTIQERLVEELQITKTAISKSYPQTGASY